ncbi:MAG: heparan-alpha-glucosaminide N-acetyltransferase domain-containing protein [Vicinamibacterales bacterium]
MALDAAGHRPRNQLRGPSLNRLRYLDWLRGVAIILMIEAHVIDAWTRSADRAGWWYYAAVFAGGLAAPAFLFLAGTGVSLAADARVRRGRAIAEAAAELRRRGAQVFVLGLLFRIQSQVLGFGPLDNLFRVDILNTMGLAMVAAATLWQLGRARAGRMALLTAATLAVTVATPIVWAAPLPALPAALEAYLRPSGGLAQFPLFPWAGYLLAGAVVGDAVAATRGRAAGERLPLLLLLGGLVLGPASWWASWQPSLYRTADFWTTSPALLGLRLGIVLVLVGLAWAHCVFWLPSERATAATVPGRTLASAGARVWAPVADGQRRLTEWVELLGRSSLFVYWVHVELVYGMATKVIQGELPLWLSGIGTAVLTAAFVPLVGWKNRRMEGVTLSGPWRVFAPVLK